MADKEVLIARINQMQQEFTTSALVMQDAIANFHFKRGYLAALQASLQLVENRLDNM